jgi:hypothetical protein
MKKKMKIMIIFYSYPEMGSISTDLKKFSDRVDEALVVIVTHPLNFTIM